MQRDNLGISSRLTRPGLNLAFSSVPSPAIRMGGASAVVARLQQSALFRQYRQAFEAATGLPLVLREAESFRTPLQGSKRINPFCATMTQNNKTCAACLQLQQRVEQCATQESKTLQGYAGLTESAVPVRVGSQVLGYLQTGQVFLRAPSKKQFRQLIQAGLPGSETGSGRRALESAYFKTRVVTRGQYDAIIQLLAVFAGQLATVSNQLLITEATIDSIVIMKGRAFIVDHQDEALCLGDVARAVNMSTSHFCKIFKKATGLSFTEYLARARIESVKQMLLNAHTRVSEAGFAAGFQSLSQFNRVFLRIAGEAPSIYRERIHGLNGGPARSRTLPTGRDLMNQPAPTGIRLRRPVGELGEPGRVEPLRKAV